MGVVEVLCSLLLGAILLVNGEIVTLTPRPPTGGIFTFQYESIEACRRGGMEVVEFTARTTPVYRYHFRCGAILDNSASDPAPTPEEGRRV